MDISVRIGLAVFESPVPVALMGFCCPRIHFDGVAFIDRRVSLPHRCQVTLVERAFRRRLIRLRFAIWMPVLTLITVASIRLFQPLYAHGFLRGALALAIWVGLLAWVISAPNPGLPVWTHTPGNLRLSAPSCGITFGM